MFISGDREEGGLDAVAAHVYEVEGEFCPVRGHLLPAEVVVAENVAAEGRGRDEFPIGREIGKSSRAGRRLLT